MKHAVRAAHRAAHRLRVAQVALDQLDVADRREVLPAPRGEVVEDADAVPSPPERLRNVGTDEAGSAGHDVGLSLAHPGDCT